MNGDVLNEIHHEPIVEAEFVPDAALDALDRQAVAVAKEYGWTIPSRKDFEEQYRREVAASRRSEE